jgi:RNA polymerase sigma-70 factor (ECF subfamily)
MEAAILISDGASGPKSKGLAAPAAAGAVFRREIACQDGGAGNESVVAPFEISNTDQADALAGEQARFAGLVEATAGGDRAAFAELFGFYAPRVKSYLLRLGLDAAQAEELAQEVMIAVWRKAASFDRRQASAATWIFRIARNRRIDVYRRDQRAAVDGHDPLFQPQSEAAPDAALEGADRDAEVRAALDALPEDQRLLVREAFYEELSHSEIAEKTGVPLGTVKSRLRLAFAKLRLRLGEHDGGQP